MSANGCFYEYKSLEGGGKLKVTEATSREDYKSSWTDATSLGELGHFIGKEASSTAPAPPTAPVLLAVPIAASAAPPAPPESTEAQDDSINLDDLIGELEDL